MTTVTIPKTQYDSLKQRARLYDTVLRALPRRKWGVERYSGERIKEFMRADRLSPKMQNELRRSLRIPRTR